MGWTFTMEHSSFTDHSPLITDLGHRPLSTAHRPTTIDPSSIHPAEVELDDEKE